MWGAISVLALCLAGTAVVFLLTEAMKCPLDELVRNVEQVSSSELMLRLQGKSALVVGGTRGIGRGIANALARSGASVHIVGRSVVNGGAVVESMSSSAPNPLEQTFGFFPADLLSVAGCRNLVQQLVDKTHVRFDYVVLTVGSWPDRKEQMSTDGLDKVVALDLLARFMVLRGVFPILNPDARIMSVLASTMQMPFPSVSDVKALIDGQTRDYWIPQMLFSAGMAGDAMLQHAAVSYPSVKFIGTNPGLVPTELLQSSNTFPAWFGDLAAFGLDVLTKSGLPMFLTEDSCGEVHVQILTSSNVNKRAVTYFNHQLEGRLATAQAYDVSFGKWVWSFLTSVADQQ